MEHWSGIDWVVLWKLYRYWFFLLYVIIGLVCKFRLFRNATNESSLKVNMWSAFSSIAGPALNVWFPVIPILGTFALCAMTRREPYGLPIHLVVPAVAVFMGIQAAALDAAIARVVFRGLRQKRTWRNIAMSNTGAALVTVGAAFWWLGRHPPIIIA